MRGCCGCSKLACVFDRCLTADHPYACVCLLFVHRHSRRGQGGARGGGAAAYIRISDFEIADDYPMPLQYKVRVGVRAAASTAAALRGLCRAANCESKKGSNTVAWAHACHTNVTEACSKPPFHPACVPHCPSLLWACCGDCKCIRISSCSPPAWLHFESSADFCCRLPACLPACLLTPSGSC